MRIFSALAMGRGDMSTCSGDNMQQGADGVTGQFSPAPQAPVAMVISIECFLPLAANQEEAVQAG